MIKGSVEELEKTDETPLTPKNSNNKAYFFIIAIVALLATNIYFYVKYKSSGENLYSITLQRENLQTDVDRIEAELDNVRSQEVFFAGNFIETESSARNVIDHLRQVLENNEITVESLEQAKVKIAKLRQDVAVLKEEVTSLRLKNEILAQQQEDNGQSVEINHGEGEPTKNQRVVSDKLSRASSIKVSNVHINGVEEKKNGEFEVSIRAKKIDKMQINFTIADNPIAQIGPRDIYVRVINPNGNLIANAEDLFYVHGEKLQYTFKESINFTNNGEEYQFLWSDGKEFKKGAYTILLYADNAIMGRSSVVLK